MKLISAATYSLSDLQRAQRTYLVTLAFLKLVQSPDLGMLRGRPWEAKEMREAQIDADVRKTVTEFYTHWKDQLYVSSRGILCRRRKPSPKIYDHDAIVLPQLYHAAMLFRAHEDPGHQGVDKVNARIHQRFIWPALNSAMRQWVKVCRLCENARTPPGGKQFLLKIIVSGSFNGIVQIDDQKIC